MNPAYRSASCVRFARRYYPGCANVGVCGFCGHEVGSGHLCERMAKEVNVACPDLDTPRPTDAELDAAIWEGLLS
jgi:hypothetical protein